MAKWTAAMRKQLPNEVVEYFRETGKRGGKIAGKNMTAAQRTARATKASRAAALARTKKKLTKTPQ